MSPDEDGVTVTGAVPVLAVAIGRVLTGLDTAAVGWVGACSNGCAGPSCVATVVEWSGAVSRAPQANAGTSNVKIHSCPPLGVLLIASYYPNAALNAHLTTVTGTEYRSGTDRPLLAINRYARGPEHTAH